MKPRIRLIQGLWFCGFPGQMNLIVGVGYTPVGAWHDWKRCQ